jgi:hypothetical protein
MLMMSRMPHMKLCLRFTDLVEPRLARTEFYPKGGGGTSAYLTFSPSEARIEGAADGAVVKWSRGVKAFCVALLRWKADPGQTRFAGHDGMASILWEPVRKARGKESNWLLALFGERKHLTSLIMPGGSASAVHVSLTSFCQKNLTLTVTAGLPNYPDEIHELTQAECGHLAERLHAQCFAKPSGAKPKSRTAAVPVAADDEEAGSEDDVTLARLRLLVWRAGMANFVDPAQTVPLAGPMLPLRLHDRVRLHARTSQPAHAAFVWVSVAPGRAAPATPLYPWRQFQWHAAGASAALPEWHLPEQADWGWEIDTPEGVETLVMLVRRGPFGPELLTKVEDAFASAALPVVRPGELRGARPLTFFAARNRGSGGSALPQAGLRLGPEAPVTRHPFEPLQRSLAGSLGGLDLDCLCLISLPTHPVP